MGDGGLSGWDEFFLSRKDFLRYSVAGTVAVWAGTAAPGGLGVSEAEARDLFAVRRVNPALFPQSVASGDPRPDGIVLWTRIASRATGTQRVAYEVARDARFRSKVLRGVAQTGRGRDYTVKVQLRRRELEPFTTYYYRFIFNGNASRTGRFKTLPAAGADIERLRFGYLSCQDYTNGYYTALAYLAEEDLDFVVHLGDYIYETTAAEEFQGGGPPERAIPRLPSGNPQAETLADYRFLYRKYKTDTNLQRVHERFATITIWDDHEFANDCHQVWDTDREATKEDQTRPGTPNYAPLRRENANRAWAEFVPAGVPYDASKGPLEEIRIYRTFKFGNLLELVMTDERLYRDEHPCGPNTPDKYVTPGCGAEATGDQSMLGETQKRWFLDRIKGSTSRWKLWGNETMVMEFKQAGAALPEELGIERDAKVYVNLDQWDGFQREREEILREIKSAGVEDFVIITGDIHSYLAGYAKLDYNDQLPLAADGENIAGVCFVCGSITSSNLVELATRGQGNRLFGVNSGAFSAGITANNPHIQFFSSESHGYNLMDVTPERIVCTMKEVSTIRQPRATLRTLKVFEVASGTNTITDVTPAAPPRVFSPQELGEAQEVGS
ncbi:Phosphodiesterase/alkaline phosphatase D [Rubrobacter radiotolerans]|uniref:Alkaline phosphatase D family protein n=1 Tax=Rubrobacter radiotolerans TaxID=42256 RepID=A0A023WZX7_RUBRA|nr:alkaline phosphatase D family protein [Rubrobacter radiotolerans]AHY45608.1 Phosphodiesterase/alkaline phosphatase D [Rubrobacter radiotolerans]MDX5893021.1 alkaline phosphatase D family protein [Rubrobacter radiotolerans]SMC02916.1 alkaline phosphatase D [Rubrobacter radiotolerans DSM 5868]